MDQAQAYWPCANNTWGRPLPAASGHQPLGKKAVKWAFPAGEFFTASAEIFVALDDQERSSG
jgi:hypothetical protein